MATPTVDLNELNGAVPSLGKSDATTVLGYVQTRLTALGVKTVTSAASQKSPFALSDLQTAINKQTNINALQALEQALEQQIGKIPV